MELGEMLTRMIDPQLAKPFVYALQTEQAHLSMRSGPFLRFLPEIAPFAVIVDPGAPCKTSDLTRGEAIYVIDEVPEIPPSWTQHIPETVNRFVFGPSVDPIQPLPGEVELDERNAAEMVALTKVASPGFFRPETVRTGRYIGLRVNGQLIAMAGERVRTRDYSEVSGVCTRPGHTGKGYARHLMLRIMHGQQTRGLTPFLHVMAESSHARSLYEHMGFAFVQSSTVTRLERK